MDRLKLPHWGRNQLIPLFMSTKPDRNAQKQNIIFKDLCKPISLCLQSSEAEWVCAMELFGVRGKEGNGNCRQGWAEKA